MSTTVVSPLGANHYHQQHTTPTTMGNPQAQIKYNSPSTTPTTPNNSALKVLEAQQEFGVKCKRKINFSHLGIPKGTQPVTVARRNARERNRVKQVNNGFSALKQHIPLNHRSKKMSKVETLKCAVDYIKNLKDMLELNGENSGAGGASHHFDNYSILLQQQLSPSGSSSSNGEDHPSSASETSSYMTNPAPVSTTSYDYENYEPVSPEDDEELLDAISWWQQS